MIIYKATNIFNDKCYIGQTIHSLDIRVTGHRHSAFTKKTKYAFHRAIRKYGIDIFSWEVLCECESKNELDEMEFN